MNRPLPPRGRGNRSADRGSESGYGRDAAGVRRLVGGVVDPRERETPPGLSRRRERNAMIESLDPVGSFLLFRAERFDFQTQLFDQRSADEAAHSGSLPADQFHDFGERCALGTPHQVQNLGLLAAFARLLGGFLRGRTRRDGSFGLRRGLLRLSLDGRDRFRRLRNVANRRSTAFQIRATAAFLFVNFLTGFRSVKGATPAKLFQVSTSREIGQSVVSFASSFWLVND
jgi:hypothetical protein